MVCTRTGYGLTVPIRQMILSLKRREKISEATSPLAYSIRGQEHKNM